MKTVHSMRSQHWNSEGKDSPEPVTVSGQKELPTHDGGGHHVLPQQEQASSTVVELVNHFTVKKEEEATTNVYQITQSMGGMLLECRPKLLSME